MDDLKNKQSGNVSEQVILNAARDVFMEKGMDGARMQEIADKAGINKAMLHYYFRSKEKLFDKVFVEAFKEFWPQVQDALKIESPHEALESIVQAYIETFMEKPYLPNFILGELHRTPEKFGLLMNEVGIQPKVIVDFLQQQMEMGYLKKTNPMEMMINIISMCVFPFAARPLMIQLLMKNDEEKWNHFMEGRKESIMNIIKECYFIKQ
ncbi:TetR/AcrR family transcriptional regulator [Carboxylicivirga caseinilyticus]|uniref:TetR/AcrR family transcriptional regulator n=1 Tax=Carboxylicivirga caseinilyticus TaxID=3417572 RepID=UPI003D34250E|nr:TetR/AcrR family transcriptional regulator [Marinilabiliaceae bacterium A049]